VALWQFLLTVAASGLLALLIVRGMIRSAWKNGVCALCAGWDVLDPERTIAMQVGATNGARPVGICMVCVEEILSKAKELSHGPEQRD
jgi:hypothetical protein